MIFQIDFNAATAVYRQLVDQVRYAAAAGTLKPRDALPTIRPLARQLHLNRNTVAKAYTELESLGVIRTVPGKGCFLEAVNTPFTPKARREFLVAKIDAALVTAHQLQVDTATFSALVAERIRFLERKNARTQQTPIKEATRVPAVPPSITTPTVATGEVEGWTPLTD
ncbi:MAG TPA: GntR family transcriptional regulator [Candidatus Baltobacteraceae bacterium]|jgi:GntR family transcriptional regulator|nr:GntR family transcriptional regulator [Candidatus Baltobacteraceae bacterium]